MTRTGYLKYAHAAFALAVWCTLDPQQDFVRPRTEVHEDSVRLEIPPDMGFAPA